jgi:hypothetical protein
MQPDRNKVALEYEGQGGRKELTRVMVNPARPGIRHGNVGAIRASALYAFETNIAIRIALLPPAGVGEPKQQDQASQESLALMAIAGRHYVWLDDSIRKEFGVGMSWKNSITSLSVDSFERMFWQRTRGTSVAPKLEEWKTAQAKAAAVALNDLESGLGETLACGSIIGAASGFHDHVRNRSEAMRPDERVAATRVKIRPARPAALSPDLLRPATIPAEYREEKESATRLVLRMIRGDSA